MRTPGVTLVTELKMSDRAGRAARRRMRRFEGVPCADMAWLNSRVYICTRAADHHGRHHASDGRTITAIWRSA